MRSVPDLKIVRNTCNEQQQSDRPWCMCVRVWNVK